MPHVHRPRQVLPMRRLTLLSGRCRDYEALPRITRPRRSGTHRVRSSVAGCVARPSAPGVRTATFDSQCAECSLRWPGCVMQPSAPAACGTRCVCGALHRSILRRYNGRHGSNEPPGSAYSPRSCKVAFSGQLRGHLQQHLRRRLSPNPARYGAFTPPSAARRLLFPVIAFRTI